MGREYPSAAIDELKLYHRHFSNEAQRCNQVLGGIFVGDAAASPHCRCIRPGVPCARDPGEAFPVLWLDFKGPGDRTLSRGSAEGLVLKTPPNYDSFSGVLSATGIAYGSAGPSAVLSIKDSEHVVGAPNEAGQLPNAVVIGFWVSKKKIDNGPLNDVLSCRTAYGGFTIKTSFCFTSYRQGVSSVPGCFLRGQAPYDLFWWWNRYTDTEKWIHVTLVDDGSTLAFYLNSALEASFTLTQGRRVLGGAEGTSVGNLIMGGSEGGNAPQPVHYYDEVVVYNLYDNETLTPAWRCVNVLGGLYDEARDQCCRPGVR